MKFAVEMIVRDPRDGRSHTFTNEVQAQTARRARGVSIRDFERRSYPLVVERIVKVGEKG